MPSHPGFELPFRVPSAILHRDCVLFITYSTMKCSKIYLYLTYIYWSPATVTAVKKISVCTAFDLAVLQTSVFKRKRIYFSFQGLILFFVVTFSSLITLLIRKIKTTQKIITLWFTVQWSFQTFQMLSNK